MKSSHVQNLIVFAIALAAMIVASTIVWEKLITNTLYNCTDATSLGFLAPGNWIHGNVAVVSHILTGRSMSEPDTIKEGWTVTDLCSSGSFLQ